MRSSSIGTTVAIVFATLSSAISSTSFAQATVAQRVSSAPDGVVRVQFAGRSGTAEMAKT